MFDPDARSEPEAGGHTLFPYATNATREAIDAEREAAVAKAVRAAQAAKEGREAPAEREDATPRRDATPAPTLEDATYIGEPGAPTCDFPQRQPRRGLLLAPRKGDALLFYDQRPDGSLDERTQHGACPVVGAAPKAVANIWAWNRDAIYRG